MPIRLGVMTNVTDDSSKRSKIDLAFEGFPAMTGQLVWMNGSEAGIALPEASIELFDRTAA